MHESEEMDNGQDKIDKKILSNLSEMVRLVSILVILKFRYVDLFLTKLFLFRMTKLTLKDGPIIRLLK